MIELIEISKNYKLDSKERKDALKNINLKFPSSGMIFITGKSGSGKSTLLYIIGKLIKPTSGNLIINDDYNGSIIFQDYNLFNELTVFQNLRIAAKIKGNKKNIEKIDEVLQKLDIFEHKNKKTSLLSGGEAQRVAIARGLIINPNVILADEPTGNLDFENAKIVNDKLKELSKNNLVIYVSHDLKIVEEYADMIIKLESGSIIEKEIRNTKIYSNNKKIEKNQDRNGNCFSVFLKFSSTILTKKFLRFFLSMVSFSISCLLLLLVFSFNNYNENMVISKYFEKYDVKEYDIYEELRHENLFANVSPVKKISKGERLLNKLNINFGDDKIVKVIKRTSSKSTHFPINIFLGEKERIEKHVSILEGRMINDIKEAAISDYLASSNNLKINSQIDTIFGNAKIVGIFKTDYTENNYIKKQTDGSLSVIDEQKEDNEYRVIYLLNQNIKELLIDSDDPIKIEKNILSKKPSLKISGINSVKIGSIKKSLKNIKLEENQVIISNNYKEKLKYYEKGNIYEKEFKFYNYDEPQFNNSLNDHFNLSKFFKKGINILENENISNEMKDVDILVNDEIYQKIKKEYYRSYFYDSFRLYLDNNIDYVLINKLGVNIRFDDPATLPIYAFKKILTGIKPLLIILAIILSVLSIFMMTSFLLTNFYQSKKDLAILRSLGIKKNGIFTIFLFQILLCFFISIFTLLIAYIGSISLINLFYYQMFPFKRYDIYIFDFKMFVITNLISLTLLFLVNGNLLRKMINVDPVDVFKNN